MRLSSSLQWKVNALKGFSLLISLPQLNPCLLFLEACDEKCFLIAPPSETRHFVTDLPAVSKGEKGSSWRGGLALDGKHMQRYKMRSVSKCSAPEADH